MKKVLILTTAALLCTGCSTAPQSGYGNYNSSSSYYSSSNSYFEYSSSSTMSYYDDNYYDDNGYYNNNDYYNEDELNELLANMTYGDFVRLYRDEIIDGAVDVTYQQLARSTNGMEGEYVKFKGEISQVLEESDGYYEYYTGLIDITYHPDEYFAYYSDTVAFIIPKEFIDVRLLVGDIVTIWGVSSGLISYETVLGDVRTVPDIIAAKVHFQNSNYGYGY